MPCCSPKSQSKSRVFVNDANAALGAWLRGAQSSRRCNGSVRPPWLTPVIGVQNVFDRQYVGSVAVNAAGATMAATKFYEPAPGRTWYVGLSAATSPW